MEKIQFAPYLKIQGKQIKRGQKFWYCNPANDYTIDWDTAGNQNNVIGLRYFFDREEARDYQAIARAAATLNRRLELLEEKHKYLS